MALLFAVLSAPALYAGSGKVTTDFYSSEDQALADAQKISKQIVMGKNSTALSISRQHCQSTGDIKFSVPMFSLGKTYVDTGNGWDRAYFATVDFQFNCRYRVDVGN